MSQNRRNNHYHYAEQYTDRRRRAKKRVMPVPRRAIFFAALMLLIFGMVTATFSVDLSEPEENNGGALIVKVRNTKARQDLAATGMSSEDYYALTGVNVDLADTAAVTDLRYNSSTKGWGTNSSITGNSSGWIPVSFTSDSSESFKIYHDGWGDAYFSKSSAAVSLNTQYTLNNTGSNPNMTYSFAAGNYGIKIENPDAYNNMKMTVYHLFDAGAVFYIDTTDNWGDDDPEIGGYFCDSTSNSATWVLATRCADIGNNHLYKLVAPDSSIYSKLVLGRFQKGTTVAQMGFSGSRFYNQSVDILYQATGTKIKLTSYGNGSTTKATVSTSSITHTHVYSAYEYTRTSSANAYTLATTKNTNTSVACNTATISLSASDRSSNGYDFDGWYRGTTSGVNNATTLVSSSRSCTVTNYAGNNYYYAKYTLASYKITYLNGAGSPVTGTISGSVADGSKTYGLSYTISSSTYTRSGYTQAGWATTANKTSVDYAFGASYATNSALTLYPVWTLNAATNGAATNPTVPQLSSTNASIVVGGTYDLDPAISACPADATRSVSFTCVGDSGTAGATISIEDDPDDADFGVFSADKPGNYDVTMTVTDTCSTGVTNAQGKATVSSNTVRIIVKPVAPTISWALYGSTGQDATHDGSSNHPYMILLGNRYYCTVTIPDAAYHANYTYTWSKDADFSTTIGTGRTVSFTKNYASGTTLADEPSDETMSFTVYCRATCNGQTNDSAASQLYYFIQPLVEDFVFVPFQKIFNLSDGSVTLSADYNLEEAAGYTTTLKFSSDNNTYVDADEVIDQFMTVYTNVIKQYIYPAGPKFFYMLITGSVNGESVSTTSSKIHTTVGTSDSVASRPIYFVNSSGVDLKNYLVMCYYLDSRGNLGYNVAQDMKKGNGDTSDDGLEYRAMIPAGATAVRFGILNVDEKQHDLHYYGTPTVTEGVIGGIAAPNYKGYTTQITLTDTTRKITASANAGTSSFYQLTCTASVY